jgi:hypothetical protein
MKRGVWPGHALGPCIRSWSWRSIRARVNTGLRQSLVTLGREVMLIAIPEDVPRADLLHAARSPEGARWACSLARAAGL